MIDQKLIERLRRTAQELIDAITLDDTGMMIAGQWKGGNGGLLSRETLVKSDALRRALAAFESEPK